MADSLPAQAAPAITMSASSDTANDGGWFPLLSAVEAQDVALVRSLLDDGADADQAVVGGTAPEGVFSEDWLGTRPLLLAAMRGHAHVVEALLGRGANLDLARKRDGCTPVLMAAQNGHHEVVRVLADSGANLDLAKTDGGTPVYVAALNGHHEVVRVLADTVRVRGDTQRPSPKHSASSLASLPGPNWPSTWRSGSCST